MDEALNDYLVEQAWGAPLVWITYPWVMSEKVGNFTPERDYASTLDPFDLRHLTVSEQVQRQSGTSLARPR